MPDSSPSSTSLLPCLPPLFSQLIAPLVSADLAPVEVVKACAVAGPSGVAWKTVAAALAGKGVSVADLESFGLAATLPCGGAMDIERARKPTTEAFGGPVAALDALKSIRAAIDGKRADPAAGAAAAVDAVKAVPGSGAAVTGLCRAAACTALDAALSAGGYEQEPTVKAVSAMAPLFKALVVRAGKPGPIAEAVGLWVATKVSGGDVDDPALGGQVFGALVAAGVMTAAEASAWAARSKGRSAKVAAVAASV